MDEWNHGDQFHGDQYQASEPLADSDLLDWTHPFAGDEGPAHVLDGEGTNGRAGGLPPS